MAAGGPGLRQVIARRRLHLPCKLQGATPKSGHADLSSSGCASKLRMRTSRFQDLGCRSREERETQEFRQDWVPALRCVEPVLGPAEGRTRGPERREQLCDQRPFILVRMPRASKRGRSDQRSIASIVHTELVRVSLHSACIPAQTTLNMVSAERSRQRTWLIGATHRRRAGEGQGE